MSIFLLSNVLLCPRHRHIPIPNQNSESKYGFFIVIQLRGVFCTDKSATETTAKGNENALPTTIT